MRPLHQLSHEAVSDEGTRGRLQAEMQHVLGCEMPTRQIGEVPLVMSQRLHEEVNARALMLAQWVREQHAAGRWRDDPRWPDIGEPDSLVVDLAIVKDENEPGGWGVRWVEFQTFLTVAATLYAAHVAALKEWPQLAALRTWDASPEFGDDWVTASREWLSPAARGAIMDMAPSQQFTRFDLYGSAHLWGLDVIDADTLRVNDGVLQTPAANDNEAWRDVPHVVNRFIMHESPRSQELAQMVSQAKTTWCNHPGWFYRVHKGLLPELPLAPRERCARADQWRSLGLPAESLVLKAVDSWGGAAVHLNVDAQTIDQLTDAHRWIVQPRYEQAPVLTARDGTPLYAELRVIIALKPGEDPWIAGRLARVFRGAMASAKGWRGAPGEGLCVVYPPPAEDSQDVAHAA
jgi:hypothetical protein